MATVNISATATPLSENAPSNSILELVFSYGDTTTQTGTTLYYSADLSDGTETESVMFTLTVLPNTDIPTTATFAYTPTVTFLDPVTPSNGQIFYTA